MDQELVVPSPFNGWELCLRHDGRRILAINFLRKKTKQATAPSREISAWEAKIVKAFEAYWKGDESSLRKLDVNWEQGTEFQRQVWRAAQDLSFSETITYGGLARKIGKAQASRAVGQALNKNPLPLFIPCHRIKAAGGLLGGFALGSELKTLLLEHEKNCSLYP